MGESTGRRRELADVAVTTLAREGMRGLTHRAVDRAAGVPEGSTSYYFRTRQALLAAVLERLVEPDLAALDRLSLPAGPADVDRAVEETAALVEYSLTAGRDRMLARYELALEAGRRPELRAALTAAGAPFRERAAAMLKAAGARDPDRRARVLVACLDGLIFDHLAGAGALALGPDDLRAAVRDLLAAFLRP